MRANAEAQAIWQKAEDEDRTLTEEEQGNFDTLCTDHKAFLNRASMGETVASGAAELAASAGRIVPPTAITIDASGTGTMRAGDITVGRARAEADPARGFNTPTDFMLSVIDAAMTQGYKIDDRLQPLKIKAAAGGDEAGEYSDPFGGFFVPETFQPSPLQMTPEDDPIGGRTTPIPMATPTVNINARVDKNHQTSVSGGLTVSRRAETGTGDAKRIEYEQVKLTASSLFGLAYATEEILTDSPISFAALIAAGFQEQFKAHLIDERLNGDGVGKFLGVNNSPCRITVDAEDGQAADTIVYANVINMRARCWGYGNAVWLANHDCLPTLAQMSLAVGTGGALIYVFSAVEDVPDTLLGRPLIYTEYTNKVGDIGDLVLGNWKEYLEGTLQPLQQAESIHVRFLEHERTFKFWLRNAGAPWWRTALTPKKSNDTMSPFVVLADR